MLHSCFRLIRSALIRLKAEDFVLSLFRILRLFLDWVLIVRKNSGKFGKVRELKWKQVETKNRLSPSWDEPSIIWNCLRGWRYKKESNLYGFNSSPYSSPLINECLES